MIDLGYSLSENKISEIFCEKDLELERLLVNVKRVDRKGFEPSI